MEKELGLNIIVREDEEDGRKVIVVNNEELGIADFGDTLDEALENFKKSMQLYLEAYPEKRALLVSKEKPIFVSRIFI